jgi:hypothetical protein
MQQGACPPAVCTCVSQGQQLCEGPCIDAHEQVRHSGRRTCAVSGHLRHRTLASCSCREQLPPGGVTGCCTACQLLLRSGDTHVATRLWAGILLQQQCVSATTRHNRLAGQANSGRSQYNTPALLCWPVCCSSWWPTTSNPGRQSQPKQQG